MHYPRTTRLAACAGALILTPAGFGQATTSEEDDNVVVLTPFEVSSDRDTGYAATETLAGTRIRTNLRDVGGAISVVTRELLGDLGATDNATLLQYTPNAEVAGTRGTYAGLGNGTSVDESSSLRAPGGAQRVRGLASADNTRDFFVTDIPWDAYNVDRIDIQRGPNSILFGLGSPAGIVNAQTRNAEFRTRGEVSGRFGSYDSWRATLDYNQVLIPNVLAVRVDALWDHEKFQQEPAFEDDERYYAAIRFDPQLFSRRDFRTSIKAKYESGEIDANRPRIVPPNDNLSAWYRPRTVSADNPFGGMGREAMNNPYDPWRTDNVVAGDGRGQIQSSTVNYQPYLNVPPNQQQPFWLMDGATGQLYRAMAGYNNVGARNPNGTQRGASEGLLGKRTADQFYVIGGLPGAANGLQLPNAQFGQYRQESLMDASIFDFYNNLIDGPNKREWENWDAYNIDISQTGWDDRVGVQFVYDRQKYDRGGDALLNGTPSLTMDILKNFQDYYLTAGADGISSQTNPNFGRPLVISNSGGGGSSYESDREYYRASLFAEFRTADVTDNAFLVKLFGKQRFNGVFSKEEYFTENRVWVENANSQEWAGYWNGNAGNGSSIQDRPPLAMIYLGPSIIDRSSPSGANIARIGSQISIPDSSIYGFDSTWVATGVDTAAPWTLPPGYDRLYNPATATTQASNPANYRGWGNNFDMNLLRYNRGEDLRLLTRAQMSMRETESYAFSWQGYLWNEAIIPTFGWRSDEVKGKGVSAQQQPLNRSILNMSPEVYRLPDQYPEAQIFKDESTAYGGVIHINRLFPNDPLPIDVSLSYSKSNNFQVTDTRRDIYGNPIENPTGETKDYGVLLATKDGKYSFRAIRYETSVKNASSGISDPGGIGRIIQQGLRFRNVFLYDLGVYDWGTRDQPQSRNTWGGPENAADTSLTPEQGRALEDQAITTWNEIQSWLTDRGFFNAWGFTPVSLDKLTDRSTYEANPGAFQPDPAQVFAYVATAPQGFTVTADTVSKGWEFELTANPTRNWRVGFNASKTDAVRSNVGGPLLDEYIAFIDSKLTNPDGSLTPAGAMPQFGNTSLNIYANVFGPWRANYVQMKLQEGAAAPEIREWRYNFYTNYTFRSGVLEGFGVGGSYRWQDEVVIGYPVIAGGLFDLSKPYYGPSEDAIDLWASYERKLTDKITWRIQLNIRNAFADEGLIPISVQPDGQTWASVRVKPVQEWFITNSFLF